MQQPTLIQTYVIGTLVVPLFLVDPLVIFVMVVIIASPVEAVVNYYNYP